MPAQLTTTTALPARRPLAVWLLICCLMIYAMVVLGGVTRLTGSGLSMVEWDPIFGIVPPLTEQQWEAVFAKYRESPEYRKINVGMDLHGFKSIYWFEYAHRLLGRTIGIVFLLPFLYFLARRQVPSALIPKLAGAFVLGGLQGLLGWYMVKSGLVHDPHVSQYRLTAHLGLALAIYSYLFWLFLDLATMKRDGGAIPATLRRSAWFVALLVGITILAGGFVAGLKAGFAYNSFPKMGDTWLPPAGWSLQPGWRNLFENIATVQFNHRLLALLTASAVVLIWISARRHRLPAAVGVGFHVLLLVALLQVGLGISTLLLHVPVALAATHQAGAVLLLSVALYVTHRLSASYSP